MALLYHSRHMFKFLWKPSSAFTTSLLDLYNSCPLILHISEVIVSMIKGSTEPADHVNDKPLGPSRLRVSQLCILDRNDQSATSSTSSESNRWELLYPLWYLSFRCCVPVFRSRNVTRKHHRWGVKRRSTSDIVGNWYWWTRTQRFEVWLSALIVILLPV